MDRWQLVLVQQPEDVGDVPVQIAVGFAGREKLASQVTQEDSQTVVQQVGRDRSPADVGHHATVQE